MKQPPSRSAFVPLLLALFGFGCTADPAETSPQPARPDPVPLTIGEAREHLEMRLDRRATRTAGGDEGLFTLGAVEPDWERAEPSSARRIACVDVPIRSEYDYYFTRLDDRGEPYLTRCWARLTVVKDRATECIETYVRFIIPDSWYAEQYGTENDLGELFANCDDRDDYCGLELYTTLEGRAVAIASYCDGRIVHGVFTHDRRYSQRERYRGFLKILGDVRVTRARPAAGTRDGSTHHILRAVDWFIDSAGGCYITVDNDGDGVAEAATTWEQWLDMRQEDDAFRGCYRMSSGGNGGASGGEGAGGVYGGSVNGSDKGDAEGSGNPAAPNPDLPYDLPYIGPTGSGTPGGTGDGGTEGIPGSGPPGGISNWGSSLLPNPIPWDDDIVTIPLMTIFPCFDDEAGEADPLMMMKISDDNISWKSNTFGYVRRDNYNNPKFHDGLDLAGEAGVTPVYAMFGGTVTLVVSGQPERIRPDKYPANYKGDKNSGGNRIAIETILPSGKKIQITYMHLDVKEKNPYTQIFTKGETVKPGQKIGIIGTTGNAHNMKPHLHIRVKENGIPVNPTPYLYTKFDSKTGLITKNC